MDIVEQLRHRASCNAGFDDGEAFKAAADEIERLRGIAQELAAARAFLRERGKAAKPDQANGPVFLRPTSTPRAPSPAT